VTTWTPAANQVETWTNETTIRSFDPAGFSNTPDFDTGSLAGSWAAKTKQVETWTPES